MICIFEVGIVIYCLILVKKCMCGDCLQPRTLQSVPEGVSMTFATTSNHASSPQRVCLYFNYNIDLHSEISCSRLYWYQFDICSAVVKRDLMSAGCYIQVSLC